jgi:hypothetical protein
MKLTPEEEQRFKHLTDLPYREGADGEEWTKLFRKYTRCENGHVLAYPATYPERPCTMCDYYKTLAESHEIMRKYGHLLKDKP